MKKEYIEPRTEVFYLHIDTALMSISGDGKQVSPDTEEDDDLENAAARSRSWFIEY